MIRSLSILTTLAVALWLGGLGALFTFAFSFFGTDRVLAGRAAPVLFQSFAYYHLIAAGVALVAAVAWRMIGGSRRLTALAVAIGLGTACAIGSTLVLGKMEQLRRDDPRPDMMEQPTFRRMHITSSTLYGIEAAAVLAAMILLAWHVRFPAPAERAAESTVAETAEALG